MVNDTEKRVHQRKPYVEDITAHLNVSAFDESLLSKTVRCETLDISAGGLQIQTSEPLDKGIELELWIKIAERPGKFLLAGEVTWCQPLETGELFHCGIQLKEKTHTGFGQWQQLFK